MTITAEIIKDSTNPLGIRLTTFVLRYPRFIHAELMTHRAFSRNASSSRAIPVEKMIEQVQTDPAMPVHWGANRPGMQAREELNDRDKVRAEWQWLSARDFAIGKAKDLIELGLHKQVANRILEPWMHITVLVTATDWSNFFSLRLHPDAQPEFQQLARQMGRAFLRSTPESLEVGQWHLPFVSDTEREKHSEDDCIKFSVARSARVSYNNHDGTTPVPEKDINLHDKLVVQVPLHASPAEHPCMAVKGDRYSGNIRGFLQYRKTLPTENIRVFPWDLDADLYAELLGEGVTGYDR